MKKLFLLLLASMVFGCSNDDDNGESIDYDQLTKKWYFVSETVDGTTNLYDDHEACGKDYIEFLDDGTFYYVDIFGCDANEPLADTSEAVWVREGNQITVTTVGEQVFTIRRLTSSVFEFEVVYDHDNNGTTETVIQKFSNN